MALKQKYATAAEVPAEVKSLYLERDGGFVLDAERDPKVDELRTSNVNLLKEIATWKQRFDGIDPEAVRALAEEKRKLEEAAQLKAGEFEKVLAARTAEKDKALQAERALREASDQRLAVVMIDDAVVSEATKRGLLPTALDDLKARAKSALRLVGGVPQVFDGETVVMGKDGVTPKNVAEWVDDLGTKAPHLFGANAGGGAVGSGTGGVARGGGQANPWLKATLNLTEQMRLQKTDPALAARLQSLAS